MDYTYYRNVVITTPPAYGGLDVAYASEEPPAEAVAGSIETSYFPSPTGGLLLAVYDLGAGRFILNLLRIRNNLGTDPAAERLLRNLLRYAAQDLQKPPVPLPADFDRQIQAFGYVP
jgi:AcrR family transcriptional regulator